MAAPFASLYRLEVLLGRLYADAPVMEGTEARFEPTEAFEDVRPRMEKAAAELPYEQAWMRWVWPLRLHLVFADGTRTGDFVLRLEGERARVSWKEEGPPESGE